MPDNTAYEHSARKLKPLTGPDPSDAFSQEAAENKKPPNGMGLTEQPDLERSETDKSDLRGAGTGSQQARGAAAAAVGRQYAPVLSRRSLGSGLLLKQKEIHPYPYLPL